MLFREFAPNRSAWMLVAASENAVNTVKSCVCVCQFYMC